jgi:outer membrane protein OmpA-like peptidoglycan-associated protein
MKTKYLTLFLLLSLGSSSALIAQETTVVTKTTTVPAPAEKVTTTTTTYNYDKVYSDLEVKKTNGFLVVELSSDVLFEFDSAKVTAKSAEKLKQVAFLIQHDNKGVVVLRGHTDSVGDPAYNKKLSLQRAQAVSERLMEYSNFQQNMFTVQGLGQDYPVAANRINGRDNPSGRAKNRRVEILIQTVKDAPIPEPTTTIIEEKTTQNADGTVIKETKKTVQ